MDTKKKVFSGRGEPPRCRIKCFRSNDERGPVFICFQTGILLLMEQRLRSVSGGYKCSSKTWLCQTIHTLLMPHSTRHLQDKFRERAKINEKLFIPIYNVIIVQNILYHTLFAVWFRTIRGQLMFRGVGPSSSEFLGGILALPINICGGGCQKIW